ncbi:alpha/beta hydrolase [Herbiconiux daphne]|uniref:Alpha/beta hydrolase n=1 Tax=Herbiconiux daphne TaxID=2970914 RepID=A0ABT2H5X5_9MICO|nr:alpha/beta hydrolase [Herbiconiux daphne]MCS5735345.1 alpha/beta hydrolase [Herbiconiux daphne]
MSETTRMPRASRRAHPRLRVAAVAVAAALVASVSAFLVYANITYPATLEPVQQVAADDAIDVDWSYGSVVMTPTPDAPVAADGTGLVFLAGAKVDPLAYAYKLSGLVEQGTTVVIVRPVLNFAIAEFRPLSDFTALAPDVTDWFVGGHSLGGVKACQYAADDEVTGLVLFASYCAGDIRSLGKPVLSISGSDDGLSTPAKIDASRADLPADTTFVEIEGANHARFGDYGLQPGDGTATISDPDMRAALTAALTPFIIS